MSYPAPENGVYAVSVGLLGCTGDDDDGLGVARLVLPLLPVFLSFRFEEDKLGTFVNVIPYDFFFGFLATAVEEEELLFD